MIKRILMLSLFALAATACTVPQLPTEHEISTAQVIQRVKCELHDAIAPRIGAHPWLARWAAGFTLTLQVKDTGSANASSDWLVPITLGTATFRINGGMSETGRRTASFKLSLSFLDAVDYDCPLAAPERRTGKELTGELGLKEWIDRMVEAVEISQTDSQFNGMGYTIEFLFSYNLGLNQSWAIVRKAGRRNNAAIGFNLSEDRTNTLDIALVKILSPSPPPVPIHVIVDNIDQLRPQPAPGSAPTPPPPPAAPGRATPKSTPAPSAQPTPQRAPAAARARPSGVDADTQRRLDSVLQDLQLRNLQVR